MADDSVLLPIYLRQWFIISVLVALPVVGFLVYQAYNSSMLPLKDGDYSCLPERQAAFAERPDIAIPVNSGESLAATVIDGEVESVWTFEINFQDLDASETRDVAFGRVQQTKRNRFEVRARSPLDGDRQMYVCREGGWD